jgi:DNA-binding beta-propeller fold protein YncE
MSDPAGAEDVGPDPGAIAERRREAQRAELRAARRARVAAVAPWACVGVLAFAAAACLVFGATGSAPDVPFLTVSAPHGALSVKRVIATQDPALGAPAGIAVSGDRLYVAYPRAGVVEVLSREGSRTATIGKGWLTTPAYVAVGPVDGRIYVSDRTRGEVGVFTVAGDLWGVLAPAGLIPDAESGPAWRPLALSFAPNGTLYVADSGASQSIAVFSPDGSRAGTLGAGVPEGRAGSAFAFVNGIAAGRSRVLVADSNNGRLVEFDPSGRFVAVVAVDGLPRGIVETASGRVVMTDAASDAVTLLDATGKRIGSIDGGTGSQEHFASPAGIAEDSGGAVYVTDASTAQVFVLATGDGTPGTAVLTAGVRWTLLVLGAAALGLAVLLAKHTRNRARARVRAHGHTL